MEFNELYGYQLATQRIAVDSGRYSAPQKGALLPFDHPEACAYHFLHLSSEVGELMNADQRWKTHHRSEFDPEAKVDEIADVIIEAINVAIFSGISAEMLQGAVAAKMVNVRERAMRDG